jgi:ACR3 family arsenite efflux pump ArsB
MLISIVVSLIVGLIVGYFVNTSFLHIFINPLLITLLLPIMITIDYDKALSFKNIKLQVITQIYNFTIIPLLTFLFIKLFFSHNPVVAFGFMFYMLLPAAGIAIFWTKKCEGNAINSVQTVLFGLIIGAIAAPIYISILLKNAIELDSIKVITTNLIFLLLPLVIGYLINNWLNKKYTSNEFNKLKPKIMMISQISVVCMVFIGISLKSNMIFSNLFLIIQIFVPVVIFYALQYFLSHIIGKVILKDSDRVSFVYSTSLKNISLALGITVSLLKENASPIIILISFTYIVQQLSAPIYHKLICSKK